MRSQPKEKEYYEEVVSAGGRSTTIRVLAQRADELQRDFEWRVSTARNQAMGTLLKTRGAPALLTGQSRADQGALQTLLHARGVKTAEELLPVLTNRPPRKHHNKYWQDSKQPKPR